MRCTVTGELRLAVVGNTGYANRSTLILSNGLHNFTLPKDDWNLNGRTSEALEATSLELQIPSGTLKLSIASCRLIDGVFVFRGAGTWDGKLAGLEGGMSGYSSFSAIPLVVYEGAYLTIDEVLEGEGIPHADYALRIRAHRALVEDAHEVAVKALSDAEFHDGTWQDTLHQLADFSAEEVGVLEQARVTRLHFEFSLEQKARQATRKKRQVLEENEGEDLPAPDYEEDGMDDSYYEEA